MSFKERVGGKLAMIRFKVGHPELFALVPVVLALLLAPIATAGTRPDRNQGIGEGSLSPSGFVDPPSEEARDYIEGQILLARNLGESALEIAREMAEANDDGRAIAQLVAAESSMQEQFDTVIWSLDEVSAEDLQQMAEAFQSSGMEQRIQELLENLADYSDMAVPQSHFGCGADPTTAFLVAKGLAVAARILIFFAPGDVYGGTCVGVGAEVCAFILIVAPVKTGLSIAAAALEAAAGVLEGLKEAFEDCEHAEAIDHLRLQLDETKAQLEDNQEELQDSLVDLLALHSTAPTASTPSCQDEDGLLDRVRQKLVLAICNFLALGESLGGGDDDDDDDESRSAFDELVSGDTELGIVTPALGALCPAGAAIAVSCPPIPGSYVRASGRYTTGLKTLGQVGDNGDDDD